MTCLLLPGLMLLSKSNRHLLSKQLGKGNKTEIEYLKGEKGCDLVVDLANTFSELTAIL